MHTRNPRKIERTARRCSKPTTSPAQEASLVCRKENSASPADASALEAAQTLADRHRFILDDAQWRALQQALDRPVQDKPRLRALLNSHLLAANETKPKKPSRALRPELIALQNASWEKLMRELVEAGRSNQPIKLIGQPQRIKWPS